MLFKDLGQQSINQNENRQFPQSIKIFKIGFPIKKRFLIVLSPIYYQEILNKRETQNNFKQPI
ncbi:unnamed protein product [Paramecium sonneborni]|uniref:Uncharacterized protein n=1 Tax=Paramecium sonneborni TaxID=65129 RepID=A0A8S1RGJ4_9CILI|nr:unnamed protein product [Paramecium sonneborni]